MRSHLRLMPSLAAVAVLVAGAGGASSAAAGLPDACKLLSPAEVGAAVGVAVAQGSALNSQVASSCSWKQSGVDPFKAVTVIVSVKPAQSYELGKRALKATPVAGLGDEAYMTGGSASYTALSVKKGQNAFDVTVRGPKDVAAIQAAEKALAKSAAARL
ncbi:MAG TPA: hypothetical protein VFW13_00110 [Phenylobacterium sp.]|nr:hypothetical protein [Phenylobacterium sp.]